MARTLTPDATAARATGKRELVEIVASDRHDGVVALRAPVNPVTAGSSANDATSRRGQVDLDAQRGAAARHERRAFVDGDPAVMRPRSNTWMVVASSTASAIEAVAIMTQAPLSAARERASRKAAALERRDVCARLVSGDGKRSLVLAATTSSSWRPSVRVSSAMFRPLQWRSQNRPSILFPIAAVAAHRRS